MGARISSSACAPGGEASVGRKMTLILTFAAIHVLFLFSMSARSVFPSDPDEPPPEAADADPWGRDGVAGRDARWLEELAELGMGLARLVSRAGEDAEGPATAELASLSVAFAATPVDEMVARICAELGVPYDGDEGIWAGGAAHGPAPPSQ